MLFTSVSIAKQSFSLPSIVVTSIPANFKLTTFWGLKPTKQVAVVVSFGLYCIWPNVLKPSGNVSFSGFGLGLLVV